MPARSESESGATKSRSTVERTSERDIVVTRTINGPARLVFEAWTKPELLRQWWMPKDAPLTLLSLDADVRAGGKYRLVFDVGGSQMEVFGKYLEVTPHSRLVWTNDEGGEDGAITTVTFEEKAGRTLVVVHDLYPSKQALDEAIASGATSGMPAQLDQLDEFIVARGASGARS